MRSFQGVALLGMVALAVSLNGCGPASNSATAPPAAVDVTRDDGENVTIELLKSPIDVAPFTVKDLDGKVWSSTDWHGKVVMVNFWATWCGPCRAEIPDLVALQNKYRDQLVVVGISEDEGPIEGVRTFAEQYKVNYPIAMTTPEIGERFRNVSALPTTFFLDKEGRIARIRVGILRPRETEATARHLAGLEVDAEIRRVDDPSRVNAEDIAQMKEVPGVDLSRVPAARRGEVLQALNSDSCTCGCGLTVAKCRVDDPSCTISPAIAKTIVDRMIAQ